MKKKESIASVIILAAGRGSRLTPFTNKKPKCLVEVGRYPILFYQLKALERYQLGPIIIVTGYRAEMIQKYVANNFPHLDVRYVHNYDFAVTSDVHSLSLVRRFFTKKTLLLNSDVLFHPSILGELLDFKKSIVCLQRKKCSREEMKIYLGEKDRVTRINKTLKPTKAAGESLGLYLFTQEFGCVFNRILSRATGEKGNITQNRGDIIESVLQQKKSLYAIDVTRYPAIEIDFPHDLKKAESEILPHIISHFL